MLQEVKKVHRAEVEELRVQYEGMLLGGNIVCIDILLNPFQI
jgi:hypothetical protein